MERRSEMEGVGIKKILVTGGAGFIGSHLIDALLSRNASVIVVDLACDSGSLFSQKGLKEKVAFEQIDIGDKEKVFSVFQKHRPEYVFHLAAEAIVASGYENPWKTFQTNIMGTVNVLEACRSQQDIKGIIVASSDKAYGKTKEEYTEDSPLRGDHPYDVSKSAADLISLTYHKTYGLPVTVTRFGNVYGEGDVHMDRIIPGICHAAISQKPLEIRSDGSYVRDYLYVKDVVAGYLTLMDQITVASGEAYNFSSHDTYSVLELVKKAEEILKIAVPYEIKNTAKNEIPYQHLNDEKVRRLGWKSEYTLESTLKKPILEWYKSSGE